jgi:hypothetical protein
MIKAKVLKTISEKRKRIIASLAVAVFILFFSAAELQTAEAHVLDEAQRPMGRLMTVLAQNLKAATNAEMDTIVNNLKHMNVDRVNVGWGDYCYPLLEMSRLPADDPFKIDYKYSYDHYDMEQATTVNTGRVDYFLEKAHKAGIAVNFGIQATSVLGTSGINGCAKDYYESKIANNDYLMKKVDGSVAILKLTWGNPKVREMWQNIYLFMITHHKFDGAWVEEPHTLWTLESDRASKLSTVDWGIYEYGVEQEHGYNPRTRWNANHTLTDAEILDMLHEREKSMTSGFKELRERITALGPRYAYPDFAIGAGMNTQSWDITSSPPSITGGHGRMRSVNMRDLSSNHYIDFWLTEYCAANSSSISFFNCVADNAESTPEILHQEGPYIQDSGMGNKIVNKNLYEELLNMKSYGASFESIFSYDKRNITCIAGYWSGSIFICTQNQESAYSWLNKNCPFNPRQHVPVRVAESSPEASLCDASISVSLPTLSPLPGTYSSTQSVLISTATTGATIHYTVDGSTPTESSPTYTSPISISSTTTIKAGAWKTSLTPSTISTAVYTITDPDTTSPVISSISSSPSSSGATITWATNEASDSQIEYGISTSYGSSTALNTALLTSHSQSLTDLTPSTLYHYRVKSKDSSGNLATGTDNTFTTLIYTPSANLLTNPGFESGTSSWTFFTDGIGSFATISPGYELTKAAKVTVSTLGNGNVQLFQSGLALEPNTKYRLTFSAYSSTGHDVYLSLIKTVSPYTNYGLSLTPNLTTSWQTFTQDFTTSGFINNITDGRLRFYFPGQAQAGDIYYLDDLKLEKVISSPADLNSDNIVNSVDLGMLMSFWNYTTKPKADLNQDGIVNSVDFGIMMSQWG